jgi:hypothetical protein
VTSVLMSEHAYNDPTLKKLAARGDLVKADVDAPIAQASGLRVRPK